jgi:hypothetical protein
MPTTFVVRDLAVRFNLERQFDLAQSLEVAEHLGIFLLPYLAPGISLADCRFALAQQIVRARFSSPAFALATIPWKYPPGDDRKCPAGLGA